MLKRIFFIMSVILASQGLQAKPSQSLDVLRKKVEEHIINKLSKQNHEKLTVSADEIDSRLKLSQCADDKLVVFNPYKMTLLRISTMGIKCEEPDNHWTLYVPVNIKILKSVVAAKHPLPKGTRIGRQDLYEIEMDVRQLKQGYFTDSKAVIGQLSKHHIMQGTAIHPNNLEMPKLVFRGEHVTISAVNDTINVSMEGIALNEGVLGDIVRVKNVSSNRVIEAKVSARRKVKIAI